MADFWFNVKTRQVEQTENKSQSKDLLGPYPTREAAELALDTAARNTEQWDEADKRWNEGDRD